MKTITLEDGTKVSISEELCRAFCNDAKPELPESFEDLEPFKGYWLGYDGRMYNAENFEPTGILSYAYATEAQAHSARAMAKLSQLMRVYNKGWIPDWNSNLEEKYTIVRIGENIIPSNAINATRFLAFPTKKLRDHFLKYHIDLIKQYYMLE